MKNLHPSKPSPRLPYYRNRNEKLISFVCEDIEIKNKIKEAAEKDNRSLNSWFVTHILKLIEEEADRQLEKNKP